MWTTLSNPTLKRLARLKPESQRVVVVNTKFDPRAKRTSEPPVAYELTEVTRQALTELARTVEPGGFLLVYGLPHELPLYGLFLSELKDERFSLAFKYWIALDLDDAPRRETLQPSHLGLLLFHKCKTEGKTPTRFHFNTATVRVPHAFCAACGLNLKDWGGKKHLMNPLGTAMSDIWRDLPKQKLTSHLLPESVLERIAALVHKPKAKLLHVIEGQSGVASSLLLKTKTDPIAIPASEWQTLTRLEPNQVYQGDCVSFLNRVAELYPEGVFDLVFADPPYNLNKPYGECDDGLVEREYLDWCQAWLDGLIRTLKPGGALLTLNLPKWAMYQAAFLNERLEFRHWIVWDALSEPRGKLMPAHYALLYYTKTGGKGTVNYSPLGKESKPGAVMPPNAPIYCLRPKCVRSRTLDGHDTRVELSDVWSDIQRIRHRRHRDAHPCQLPEKLMERVIQLTTNPGGLVFDPFGGAGTTALAARKLGRDFVMLDLDPNYVELARRNLALMEAQAQTAGVLEVPRARVAKPKSNGSKKEVEMLLQSLARQLGRVPLEEDIAAHHPTLLETIDGLYPNRSAAIKRSRVALVE
ncbi:MAG TPA: DNA methyltransferase [Acidobacteriota bacterium]|nr:DNA methyltransferase [Acidobacteriota bacterium]